MNQLIDLLDGALQANLSKRQWAAFAAVLRQTLGYRKHEDDLSARRFEQLTGIRRNHIWQAKNELVAMGLIHSRPGQYGDILGLTLKQDAIAYPSSDGGRVKSGGKNVAFDAQETATALPETGQPLAQIRPEPGPKQDTTLSNLTESNHNSTVVGDESALCYPAQLSPAERDKAPPHLDGLSPIAAQQVLDVWALKIERGEVRKSRIGLLIALVKAQRLGQLNTDGLPQPHPATPVTDPQQQQRQREREDWLEQQAQQGWLRDMARLSGLPPDKLQPGYFAAGGGS